MEEDIFYKTLIDSTKLILSLVLIFCISGLFAWIITNLKSIWNYIINIITSLDTRIIVGSTWGKGRYEIVKIESILPDSLRIVESYTSEKDLITIIYVRDLKTLEVSEYKLSEFKKWFRK